MKEVKYYSENGEFKPINQIAISIIILSLTLCLGYAYSLVMKVIPFPYINVLISIGAGSMLYYIYFFLARALKIRNQKQKKSNLWLIILSFYYFTWIAFLVGIYVEGAGIDFMIYLRNIFILFDFSIIGKLIGPVYEYGNYSIFEIPINGFILLFTWVIEAALLITIPIVLFEKSSNEPYSESMAKWYPKYTLYEDYETLFGSDLSQEIVNNPLEFISELKSGSANRGSKIHIYHFEQEPDAYLCIERYSRARNDPEKVSTKMLIHNLTIPSKTAKELIETFHGKQQKIL